MLIRIRRSIAAALIGIFALTAAGCFGTFRLTRAVYGFNSDINSKVARSLVMWALIIIPVYILASLGDILIFNVIEFWSGGSVASEQTMPDGTHVAMTRIAPDVMRVRVTGPGGKTDELEIVKVGARAGLLRRPGGAILATVELGPDGSPVRGALASAAP
jgi:hypothetical protein